MARNTNGEGFSLKDELFNKHKISYLGELFAATEPTFKAEQFEKAVMATLPSLGLKERIVHIATALEEQLDDDFRVAAKQLAAALPPPLDPTKTDDDFGDFIFAPLGEYVVRNGLSKKHLKTSLKTLQAITQRFSMEDAIRYFINEYPKETLRELEQWTSHKNYHVRRLVSEGTRALLPWSGRLTIDPLEPLPFLDTLHADPTRYVTRSVANHLNDITKSDPKVVIDLLKKWKKEKKQFEKELDWMTRHALRTLLKQGNQEALALLGYSKRPAISVSPVTLTKDVIRTGESVAFEFSIRSEQDVRLMVDYAIDFVKANGKTKLKVHKLKNLSLQAGEEVVLSKTHLFKKNATTLTYHSGTHNLVIQINGKQYQPVSFELLT